MLMEPRFDGESRDDWLRRRPAFLVGTDLRYCLTDLLCATPGRAWRVKELVAQLVGEGFELGTTPSRTVSDHLRAEVRRGRAVKVGWGTYEGGWMPDSTRRRIRKRAALRRRWLAELGVRR